jgi:hypothetical protein
MAEAARRNSARTVVMRDIIQILLFKESLDLEFAI